ncbi:unnamed protein product [Symbiodinium natans]|uniref:RanBP2-type domain-containing protein n=1 Tax=Symbiodinium natans TaxID=878477 RepID=A0A812QVZ9_9DINO|nr:unnamed protein product [Symbiodinium natans]
MAMLFNSFTVSCKSVPEFMARALYGPISLSLALQPHHQTSTPSKETFEGRSILRPLLAEAWALELSHVAHAMEEMVLAIQKGLDRAELKLVALAKAMSDAVQTASDQTKTTADEEVLDFDIAEYTKCGSKRKDAEKKKAHYGKGNKARTEGDWNCPKCKFLVCAVKEECTKCGVKRKDAERVREDMAAEGLLRRAKLEAYCSMVQISRLDPAQQAKESRKLMRTWHPDKNANKVAEASAKTPAAEPRTTLALHLRVGSSPRSIPETPEDDTAQVTAIVGHVACEAVTNWHGVAAAVAAEELQPIATTPFSEGNQPKIGEKIDEDAAALAAASLACTSGQSTRCTSTVAVLFATGLKWPEKTSVCESGEPRSPQGEEALALDEVAETSAKTPPSEPRTKASQQDLGALQTSAQAKEELQPIATTPFSEGNQPKIGEKIDEDAAALAAASGAESLENRATRLRPEKQEPRSPQARALDEMAETSAKTPPSEPRTKASQQDLGALQTSAQAKEAVTNWHGVEGRVDFVEQAVVDLNIEAATGSAFLHTIKMRDPFQNEQGSRAAGPSPGLAGWPQLLRQ